jgi:hypothetical protein
VEGRAGARGQGPDLGDHLAQVFVVDAAGLAQARHVALGQQVEIVEQGGHAGS